MIRRCHISDKPQYYGKPPTFDHTVKKLHRQQKNALDEAVRTIASQPEAGETKVGDLAPEALAPVFDLGLRIYSWGLLLAVLLILSRGKWSVDAWAQHKCG